MLLTLAGGVNCRVLLQWDRISALVFFRKRKERCFSAVFELVSLWLQGYLFPRTSPSDCRKWEAEERSWNGRIPGSGHVTENPMSMSVTWSKTYLLLEMGQS